MYWGKFWFYHPRKMRNNRAFPSAPVRAPLVRTEGTSPQFWYMIPPPLCPPGPVSCQGSIATGHTYGGPEGAPKNFFVPLVRVAPLPAQVRVRVNQDGILGPSWWGREHQL